MIDEESLDFVLLVTWGRKHRRFDEVFRTHRGRE